MKKICGIYKITSPSGKIYIGLSTDISNRFRHYKRLKCKRQVKLYHSFLKHSVKNHTFEIIHECEFIELNKWEKHYVDLFKTFNTEHGLNLKDGGGAFGRHSEETRKKISELNKGKPSSMKGKKHTEETKIKMSVSRKGEKNPMFGKPKSEETKRKLSIAGTGKVPTDETRKKMSQWQIGEPKQKSTVLKMSESMKGRPAWNKGKPHSDETRKKLSTANMGVKRSLQSIAKQTETIARIRQERLTMIF